MPSPQMNSASPSKRKRALRNWRKAFLTALAKTSNVTAAAQQACISPSWVYRLRREDPDFAAEWLRALCEGYDHLEMELLCRLRAGESRDGKNVGAKNDRAKNDGVGAKYDNAAAIRLLALHRANAERGRALRENDDEQAVLDSIDAMIRDMRERAAANAAILAEDEA